MPTKPLWRKREDALLIGGPLVVAPVLALVPLTVSLLIDPAFPHARVLGLALLPLFGISEIVGLDRLTLAMRRDFDVLTFFAAGIVFVFWILAVCDGVLLGIVVSRL